MSKLFHNLERQRGRLISLGGLLLTAMCATLILLSWSGDREGFRLAVRWPTLVGLLGMVLLFVLYAQNKHRQLAAAEERLRDLAIREASLKARFGELSFLFDISTQLQLRLDLEGMLDLAVQRLIPCLDAHQASIMLHNEASGMLEVKATAGIDAALVKSGRVHPGEGIAGHVFATGERLTLSDQVMRERFAREVKHSHKIVSGLCVPMRFQGAPIGVVSVSRTSGEPFSQLHAAMLETFAEHCAATVVKTHHHHQMLQHVSRTA